MTTDKIEKRSWLSAFLLSFLALPLLGVMIVCAYGFVLWFGQMLFWGPPS